MSTSAIELRNLEKSFGLAKIIQGVNLQIGKGERHAIIGPNGAGKSTLFNLITGKYVPTGGGVYMHGTKVSGMKPYQINRMGLSRSFQITNIFHNMTVFENVRCGLLWSMGYKYSFWQMVNRQRALSEKADEILEQINLTARRDMIAGALAYAEQRALEIGITIAGGRISSCWMNLARG
ncbi:ATP-binding cassette domain-containing protein [Aquicoccus sp. G2-2]|uniref:ATP-binding cassette domain-containing protein n=1 Tax=Aquicoccus sp. G2-2 TaxID=3092120 RepID=UPI002ADF6E58|nr:ATP-binding cassette domain-containing protein [Aquicoccus sp. G2-2]MEA1113720.1 ATP-binding cassette domain-containing protein [Aquicoccus sp. G2-2]